MADVKAELQSHATKFKDVLFAKKDPEAIVNFYTEDCRLLPPGAPALQGREAVKACFGGMLKLLGNVVNMKNEIVDVVSMDSNLATSVNKGSFLDADGKVVCTEKSVTVWKKVDGIWLVHWTAWNLDQPTPA